MNSGRLLAAFALIADAYLPGAARAQTPTPTAPPATATPSASVTPAPTQTPIAPLPSATPAPTGCPADTLLGEVNNPLPTGFDRFGISVDISQNLFVVGTDRDLPGNTFADGRAFVFDATTGALVSTLLDPDVPGGDSFGHSVGISGNFVVVGAPTESPGGVAQAGSAYIFDAGTGALLRTLEHPDPAANARFGQAVAIDGSLAVVGAHFDDIGATSDAGRAFVFDVTNGGLVSTLVKPGAPAGADQFGSTVAISGTIVAVTAAASDFFATNAGGVFVFDAISGSLTAALTLPDPFALDSFGFSLAISGSTLLAGTPGKDVNASGDGVVYVYDLPLTSPVRTIFDPLPAVASDFFGGSVSIFGDTALISARGKDMGASGAGSAYLFRIQDGSLLQTFDHPAPATGDNFGFSLALSEFTAVIGAPFKNLPGADVGIAYRYTCAVLAPSPTPLPTSFPSPTATPSATPTPSPIPCCPGDADNSGGAVNAADFLAVQANFGLANGQGGLGDADCSGGSVNAADFLAVQANFGSNCGA